MLEGRSACAAVITGNMIVVMGGLGKSDRLRSVEAFSLGSYSWRYLPAMNDIRTANFLSRQIQANFRKEPFKNSKIQKLG